jgi:photosystem II stability/assembly factor-like uncharacterized protein
MNQRLPERLYKLLPGIYQSYDALQGEPLRALLALLERELQILETDTDRLYDNWFIETCEDWVVPYIGDLLDTQMLYSGSWRGGQERRAFIANTLAYRRRKGTSIVLEQLALDISGWHGRAVEYLNLLARTPGLTTGMAAAPSTVDLRQAQQLAQLGTPFEQGAFTAEVRSSLHSGQYNPNQVGLFLWRLQSYPLSRVTARSVSLGSGKWRGHCYTFNPLGYGRVPLFNQPQTKASSTEPTTAIHVPGILSRAVLSNEIKRCRTQRAMGHPPDPKGYFGLNPVLQIFVDGQTNALLPEQILITNLENWDSPEWKLPNGQADAALPSVPYEVAVDPELGRLVILNRPLPRRVEVSYAYGFSGDIGGGPYDRPSAPTLTPSSKPILWKVQQEAPFDQQPLQAAIDQWHQTTEIWQACRNQTYIPLAKLQVPELPYIDLETDNVRPKFKPGIIQGLEVLATPGANTFIVHRGLAIDAQGRLIQLKQNYSIPLDRYKDQTVVIVASHRSYATLSDGNRENQSQVPELPVPIDVISASMATRYSNRTYIHLSLLAVNIRGQVISQSLAQRNTFQPGIVEGLAVKLNAVKGELVISPGLAVVRGGRCIRLDINERVPLAAERHQAMVLLLSRRTELGKPDQDERRGQQWQLDLIADGKAAQNDYPPDRFLRLVRVPQLSRKPDPVDVQLANPGGRHPQPTIALRPTFREGIVWGLTVIAHPGQNRAIITPGLAVGVQGQQVSVTQNQRISLRGYPSQTVGIYLIYQPELPSTSWTIRVLTVPPAVLAILLASVTLDEQGRLSNLPDLSHRQLFQPGILLSPRSETPLKVTAVEGKVPPQVTITSGTAVDAQGRLLSLSESDAHTFDLGNYWGQTVFLFLAYESRQGWQLGVVVEESDTGRIEIQDNATYDNTNLTIRIPAKKQLQIVAAKGCRPHIGGNLAVQGNGNPGDEPGTLLLEGLLLEGQLTVLPGDLQNLWINHCTLVPASGGLWVQALPASLPGAEPDEWSMIALAMYYIQLIRRLIAINWNEHLTPSQIVTPLIQLGMQRVQYLIAELWGAYCSPCPDRPFQPDWNSPNANNEQLEIVLESSICGPVQIELAIAQLTISNSIVDAGSNQLKQSAIAAFSTPVVCNQTTVLGRTIVLSIEATNTLFTDTLTAWRQQVGCLRFCYVPDESQTPPRYRCQPDLLLEHRLEQLPVRVTALASKTEATGQLMLFAATTNGIWRLQDGTWKRVNNGLIDLHVKTLAIDDINHGIYAGTTSGYLFVSQNDGDSWESLFRLESDGSTRCTLNTTHINQIVSQGGQLFIATLGGRVFRSSDWIASKTGLEQAIWNINTLAVQVKTGYLFAGTAGTGLYYSQELFDPHNKEPRWAKPRSVNLANQTVTALAIAQNGQIFVGTTGPFTKPGGIFHSTNNGDTWTPVPLPAHQRNINTIAIYPDKDNGAIFVGTMQGGMLRSQDQGKTWETLASLPHRNITAIAITDQGWIFVGTAGGMIWHSTDNGNHWVPIHTGFNNAADKLQLLNQIQPSFTSTQYGDPGYAQLSLNCADEIRMGGEDGAEMGSFNSLKQTQRIANLQTSLEEYLRFGLEVSIIYVT